MLKRLREAASVNDLARILAVKVSWLTYVVYKLPPDQKYTTFTIPKKSGGEREINAPTGSLKQIQGRLAGVLYDCRRQLDEESKKGVLSHGFREGYSIITNAIPHQKRRYVLNLDLQDFFPTFNFGRVRGYFLKNRDFQLNDKVATVIAQIACHENSLPQGSPCSPIISDLIAHLLDVRLVQLAKKCRATYSRYADDLTFSTNHKSFPSSLALLPDTEAAEWVLGNELVGQIQRTGFTVNPAKTRMQHRASRQLVTGLTVNAKVNIRPDYFRRARAMCHSLFVTGLYHHPNLATNNKIGKPGAGTEASNNRTSHLAHLEGVLSHIHHVKDYMDNRDNYDKARDQTAARQLYARFLFYRRFIVNDLPLIISEGNTDNIYLGLAIRALTNFHPQLGCFSEDKFISGLSLLKYGNQAHRLLGLGGGTGDLKHFIRQYGKIVKTFKHQPLRHPVIVLIDNDSGAKDVFSAINGTYKVQCTLLSAAPFYRLTDNLYLIKTPERGPTGTSCIEKLFDAELLAITVNGKKFNMAKDHGAENEYGKVVFAEQVIRPRADKIDFSNFALLLQRIAAVLDDYALLRQAAVNT